MREREEFKGLLQKATIEVSILKDLQEKNPIFKEIYVLLKNDLNRVKEEAQKAFGLFRIEKDEIPACKEKLKRIDEIYNRALVRGILTPNKDE
ncbi:MAG: hypothetical protein JW812_00880 [Alphaproteobacteria bacterium]|nr:hypothetical protein [Alphaproteobacteria bacterium]MBN2779782.1 hypothetical protein [Alphaproteobacteria bacterium]